MPTAPLGRLPTPLTSPLSASFSAPNASAASVDPGGASGPFPDTFVTGAVSPAGPAGRTWNPAADVLPTLGALNPLTYQTQNPSQLPYLQASERDLVAQARAKASPAEMAAAKRLSDTGTSSLWSDYVAQYAAKAGPVRAAELNQVMRTAMNADVTAYSLGKQQNPEPRPFELGQRTTGDSYPSGHASTAYAAATVLSAFWPERASEFESAAANVARSRVLLDMHFAGDVAAGARLGVAVAQQVLAQNPPSPTA